MVLVALGTWAVTSAVLLAALNRDYRSGHVTRGTELLLWLWHALNYTVLVFLGIGGIWGMALAGFIVAVGWLLFAIGLAVIAAGFYEFRSARRLTGARQDEVIDSGVYRFSRHPQYLGIILTLIGGALAGSSGAALVFALALSGVFIVYLPIEERYAVRGLGEAYERYRRRTPLLIGRPR